MNLVFLHGPAAVGKLTVARELSRLTGYRVFHNHLVVDALTAVFEFGSEPFVRLREEIWLSVFREAARAGTSLIFTFAPEKTVTLSFPSNTFETVEGLGGKVLFAELTCESSELERRIQDESRAEFGKLRSLELFRDLRGSGSFDYPALPDFGLKIDSGELSPGEAALRIRDHFDLKPDESDA